MGFPIAVLICFGLIILVLYLKHSKKVDLAFEDLPEPPAYEDVIKEYYDKQLTLESFLRQLKQTYFIISYLRLQIYLTVTDIWYLFASYLNSNYNMLYHVFQSKKADLNRVISILIFVFMIYFLFLSVLPGNERFFVLAVNDNSSYLCSNNATCSNISDCDISAYGNSGTCVDCTYWALGTSGDCTGDASCASTTCCGDDTGESYNFFNQTEVDGCNDITNENCIGVNDNATDQACCDNSLDCVLNGVCYDYTDGPVDIDGDSIPGEFCSNTQPSWNDCDSAQSSCTASVCSSRPWIVGGESAQFAEYDTGSETECCGDDSGEYNFTYRADNAVMESGPAVNDSDVACCNSANSCVSNFQCADDQSSTLDADGDGDNDYCDTGEWKDCQSDSDCIDEKICSAAVNDCVNPDGYIIIRNLGTTGIEETNQEFTSTRAVFLELNFSSDANACRYTNYDFDTAPSDGYSGWSAWENCVENRIWQLTNGTGEKRVFYMINFTDRQSTFNDTIYYNHTGGGLDTTPPYPAIIVDGDYTNNNQSISITWYNASDPESVILGIPLRYQYMLYLDNGTILDTVFTTYTNKTTTGLNLKNGSIVYANLTVINSAGLTAKTTSDGLTIDLEKPGMWPVQGSFLNKTVYQSLPGVDDWFTSSEVNFSWSGYDILSGSVVAYSYILTQNINLEPDNVPEGVIGSFASLTTKSFFNLASGKYYFKVKPKDEAGNWGDSDRKDFSVDNTQPSKPNILTETKTENNITYTWSQSTDPESSVVNYRINLTDIDGLVNLSVLTNSTSVLRWTFSNIATGSYNASVGALNGVGLWRWSNEDETQADFTPPTIYVAPNSTGNVRVVTTSPILKAWTNENAVCYYNNTKFTYSNTTYHETKILSLKAGTYGFNIECIDSAGNSRSEPIFFTIQVLSPATINNAPNNLSTYENTLTTFTINITNTFDLASVHSDRFTLFLDQQEIEGSIFDRGDGNYNISFEAPDSGSYNLRIAIAQIDENITLNVNNLFLTGTYQESGITPENKNHLSYYNPSSSRRIGLATNTENPIIKQDINVLNISNVKLEKELFIFNTKPSVSLNKKEILLNEQRFLELSNPSFGYQIDDNYIITYILRYDDFVLKSEIGNTLGKGQHNVHLIRIDEDDDTIIKFTKKTGNRIILTG